MPRKTILTPDKAKRIADLIAAGNDQETAAQAAGISKSTHYSWLSRGRLERERLEALENQEDQESTEEIEPEESERPFVEYLDAIEKALAEAEAGLVLHIRTAAKEPRTWQAAAWLLTHGPARQKWKDVNRTEISGPDGKPIQSETKSLALSEQEIIKLADEILGLDVAAEDENVSSGDSR